VKKSKNENEVKPLEPEEKATLTKALPTYRGLLPGENQATDIFMKLIQKQIEREE